MSLITEGKYPAKITDYGITLTKGKLPQVCIQFEFEAPDADSLTKKRALTWYGSLKEGRARELTIEQVLRCGLVGDDLRGLANGKSGNALNLEQEVGIEVEVRSNESGKLTNGIKWINRLGVKTLDVNEAMNYLGDGFKGDIMAARQKTGMKSEPSNAQQPNGFTTDDIPF